MGQPHDFHKVTMSQEKPENNGQDIAKRCQRWSFHDDTSDKTLHKKCQRLRNQGFHDHRSNIAKWCQRWGVQGVNNGTGDETLPKGVKGTVGSPGFNM